jgi:hypothetical protein
MDNPYPSNLDLHVKIMNQIYRFVNGPGPYWTPEDAKVGNEICQCEKSPGAITKEEGGPSERAHRPEGHPVVAPADTLLWGSLQGEHRGGREEGLQGQEKRTEEDG